jgi:hypothetical protein
MRKATGLSPMAEPTARAGFRLDQFFAPQYRHKSSVAPMWNFEQAFPHFELKLATF